MRGGLVEAVAERRRSGAVDLAIDDEQRACGVCGRRLRGDNASGRCRSCQRAHLAARRCGCGCGAQLSARSGRLVAGPACVLRLVQFRRLALDLLGPLPPGAMSPIGGDIPGEARRSGAKLGT